MGPITDWWFEGFDLNDESSLGFSTEMAHYYLETPMAEYRPFMTSVKEKIFLAKIVIDILENVSDDKELSYEDLLNSLKVKHQYCLNSNYLYKMILLFSVLSQDKVPPEGLPIITEEILLKNGVFVLEQIQSYDAVADENEKLMASMPCAEELSRRVDYDLNSKSDEDTDDDDDDDSDVSICQVGEIQRAVIDFIDLDDIDSSDDDGEGVRRVRRFVIIFETVDLLKRKNEMRFQGVYQVLIHPISPDI